MATATGARMPYLSLALFAQRALDALLDFIESGDEKELEPALGETIQTLKSRGPASGALGAFSQVRTLHEAWPGDQIGKTLERLEKLRKGAGGAREPRMRDAEVAAEQFYRLATRALRGFERPSAALPATVRELCRTD